MIRPLVLVLGLAPAAVAQEVRFLESEHGQVWAVAFGPDGRRLLSGNSDRTASIWDVESGRVAVDLAGHPGIVQAVAFDPSGRLVATGGWESQVQLWDATSGQRVRELAGVPEHAHVLGLAFSNDGAHVVAALYDGEVLAWSVEGGEPRLLGRHDGKATSVAFGPDGRLASGGSDKAVLVRDLAGGAEVLRIGDLGSTIEAVAWSGGTIAAADWDLVRLIDAHTGAETGVLRGHENHVDGLAFAPDGTKLASSSYDGTVRVWDPTGRIAPVVLGTEDQSPRGLAFGPDGRWLAAACRDGVRIWPVR